MSTSWNPRSSVSTSWTGRPSILVGDTIAPIITGLWNDLNTWTETGKYWNDNGDGGTAWTGRILI